MKTIKRLSLNHLNKCLQNIGAVLITGPKYCGKTFLSRMVAQSEIVVNENTKEEIKLLGSSILLDGKNPRLIDEWQEYPYVWDMVREDIDKRTSDKYGLYILTGSTRPIDRSQISHSGAGRIIKMKLQTLTFAELFDLDETNSISLKDLFDQKEPKLLKSNITMDTLDKQMIIGGWPEIAANKNLDSSILVKGYIESLIDLNSEKHYSFRTNKATFKHVLKSLSRLLSSQINKSTILKDLNNEINIATLNNYLEMLYENDVIFDIPVWRPLNRRSGYSIRTTPKTYICDTSLSCKLLNINNVEDFKIDGKTTGLIFENQVMKDLTVYVQELMGELYFYRDEKDNEIDAIIELEDGRWAAIEIKLSLAVATEASEKLLKTIKTMKLEGKNKDPSFIAIITATDQMYKLTNGVYIIPHTLLRP